MGEDSLGAMKADYLKRKADGEVRKQNYRDAILHYTEALEVRESFGASVSRLESPKHVRARPRD